MKYSGLTLNVILVNPGMFQSQLNLFPPLGSSSTFSWDCLSPYSRDIPQSFLISPPAPKRYSLLPTF